MTGETEYGSFRVYRDSLDVFTAPGAGAAIIDPAEGGSPANSVIAPPKKSTLTLLRMHGYIAGAEGTSEASSRMKVLLAKIATAQSPALTLRQLKIAWVHGLNHTIVGTPVNSVAPDTTAYDIEVNFESRNTQSIHNKGSRPGSEEFGYVFIHQGSVDFAYMMDIVVEYKIVYDDETGKSKMNWLESNDEETADVDG